MIRASIPNSSAFIFTVSHRGSGQRPSSYFCSWNRRLAFRCRPREVGESNIDIGLATSGVMIPITKPCTGAPRLYAGCRRGGGYPEEKRDRAKMLRRDSPAKHHGVGSSVIYIWDGATRERGETSGGGGRGAGAGGGRGGARGGRRRGRL